MAHVLIVTLGPIQDFIAAARRTRDLWFGSWLLSELSKATAQAMAEECGLGNLVFPGTLKPNELRGESDTSVANKIVIRVPDGLDPMSVAKWGEAGMRSRLKFICDEAFGRIAAPYFDRPTAENQVSDLIEYAWVSALESGPQGYSEARRKAEALLSMRKNTRLWDQVKWGKDVPKSSIDGERESVLHEDLFDKVGKAGGLTPQQVRTRYGVGRAERMCGVGLLKRHGKRETSRHAHRFISTGHLAAWPLYERAQESSGADLQHAWTRYLSILEASEIDLKDLKVFQENLESQVPFASYDGSLLFEGRLPDLFEEVLDIDKRQKGIVDARVALSEVLKELGLSTPLQYYAILLADGDHMGEAIKRQETFESHQSLSRGLDRFAQEATKVVEKKHHGELVYSGGDDVLAFVPLHRAVDCARDLADEFSKQLSGFPIDDANKSPTLSVGIGISHCICLPPFLAIEAATRRHDWKRLVFPADMV